MPTLLYQFQDISFSNKSYSTYLFKKDHPQWGQYSLMLYLSGDPSRAITKEIFSELNRIQQIIPAFIITFLLGTLILLLGNFVKKKIFVWGKNLFY